MGFSLYLSFIYLFLSICIYVRRCFVRYVVSDSFIDFVRSSIIYIYSSLLRSFFLYVFMFVVRFCV